MVKGLKKKRAKKIIGWMPLCILGIFCYLYSVWVYNLAELNIQFPFLNFPVFVGEFLLGLCLCILFIRLKRSSTQLQRIHYLIFAYFLFVLVKALYGYGKWGPLAFRNAALFYYSLFAIIGYYFYERKFFKNKFIKYGLLFLFISHMFLIVPYKTFYFTYFMLALLFFMQIKNKKLRGILIALFIIFCYEGIRITIWAGRAVLVGSFFSYLFLLIITFCRFVNIKLIYKKIALVAIVIIFSLIVWNTTYKTAVISLIKWTDLSKVYEGRLGEIGYIYQEDFKFANPSVKVYEENKNNPFKLKFQPKSKPKPKQITVSEVSSDKGKIISLHSRSKEELIEVILENTPQSIIQAEEEAITKANLQRKSKEELIEIIVKDKPQVSAKPEKIAKGRSLSNMQQNILYRWYMWQEIFEDLFREKKIIGFDFGKPFRSKKIQLLRFDEGWKTRVGWLTPHNSYVHMLYRSGIVGSLFILIILALFIRMTLVFIRARSIKGILLISAILYWLIIANFMVILELPYFAIPFWSLFGVTLRYCHIQREQRLIVKGERLETTK